jgi:hypothetical protein
MDVPGAFLGNYFMNNLGKCMYRDIFFRSLITEIN